MDQLKLVRQLKKDGIAIKEIVRRTGISRNTVKKYLALTEHLEDAPIPNRQAPSVTDKELAEAAYNEEVIPYKGKRYADLMVHFCGAEAALRKTGVTKKLLWAKYSQEHADHYNYSQYCYYLQIYLNQHDLVMHLQYNPGDMIMVDFAGKKLAYVVVDTGEVIDCQIFVAILPHSGLIYCKAVESQQTADFVRCIKGCWTFMEERLLRCCVTI